MNEEQGSVTGERTDAKEVGETDIAQTRFSGFVASAKLACDSVKASENDAKNVLIQLNQILTDAKAALEKISESTPKFAAAATEVEMKRSAVAMAAAEAEVKRAAVATHAQQIDEAQKRATEVRGDLDSLLVSVKQTQAEAEGLKQSVESAKNSASQADADIVATKAAVDENAKAVTVALAASNAASAKTKGLANIAEGVEQRLKDYEAKLASLSTQCDDQLNAIKSLLPGATGAACLLNSTE